jgi:DNA-binding response OmpR family regulator
MNKPTNLDKLAARVRELERRAEGHAELITMLYERLKASPDAAESPDPIPRIYLPILETKPRKKVMTIAHATAAQKRRRA